MPEPRITPADLDVLREIQQRTAAIDARQTETEQMLREIAPEAERKATKHRRQPWR